MSLLLLLLPLAVQAGYGQDDWGGLCVQLRLEAVVFLLVLLLLQEWAFCARLAADSQNRLAWHWTLRATLS